MTTTLRNAIFQLHWFFGITAGLVLAVVGVSGGILSFEDAILKSLNPGVMTVEPRERALTPGVLLERVRAQRPETPVASLQLSANPRDAAVVGFAAKDGGRRGERRHVDPYSGEVLAEPRHQQFFRTTMQLHRWLVADDVGKQVVGASTVILIFFCLSGLYLRWPRRIGSVRTWLGLDWRQKGRNFLWHLHSVVGTWVLLAYLVMSLSGLWWSYGWYRDAVNAWAADGAPDIAVEAGVGDRGAAPEWDIDAAWQAFTATAPAWGSATLGVPKGDEPISIRYLDADPAHERARNELTLDRWTLAPIAHERYDDGSWRQKIGASMFALHRGSFFGVGGVVVFMLASLLMPLFAITGWMLYLDRRRRQRAARSLAAAAKAAQPATSPGAAPILIAFASQTGTAEQLAWQTAAALRAGGRAVDVQPLGRLLPEQLRAAGHALFVVSTFGDGEAPDAARGFARRMRAAPPPLRDLHYGVLALGDREYDAHYCGFGIELDQWLLHAGARPLFDRVDVDAGDPGALRHWQHHIGLLAGCHDLPDWSAPAYRRWQLDERVHLNPGSPGGPAFHVALTPADPADLHWEAGDIAEVGPRNAAAAVDAWLQQTGLEGDVEVRRDGGGQTLARLLAGMQLPAAEQVRGQDPQSLADTLTPLPHREYSIASLPADGSLQLLVRQMRRPDGSLGSGSGWLTVHAPQDATVELRIRRNPSFHAPADDRPLVLVGNGTGLAGLRAILKARIASGQRRNWLLFGERTAAHDFHYRSEIERWLREGQLKRLDLGFSRDASAPGPAATGRRYVQHLLHEQADLLRTWLADGAAVYVCGSLQGMAPAVDEVLRAMVGERTLEAMASDGRYRRDVY